MIQMGRFKPLQFITKLRIKMTNHTVKTLKNKLDELIKQGYEDYEVIFTYDNGYGGTSSSQNKEPKIKSSLAYGNKVIFHEER